MSWSEQTEFWGRRVVVTGAAGVLGRWICEAFARHGARLCVTDVREEALAALCEDPTVGRAAELRPIADLRSAAGIRGLVATVEDAWGAPDIVINNAGIYPSRRLLDMRLDEWHQVMDVNLHAPFQLIQLFSKLMIESKVAGCFVNITSRSAERPRVGAAHYAVSKAGLSMLTRAFALELAPHGIRVNAISPGLMPGSEVSSLSTDYVRNMVRKIPLGRTPGSQDAAAAILFLCSAQAAYITGTTLVVDGGSSAGDFELPLADDGTGTKEA
jgi:3-oxoacyl-[acyl-carrier protein] reductase